MSRDVLLPVSFAQQRLWYIDQMSANGSEYLIPVVLRLTGKPDVAALSAAVDDLVARHESLRTVITEHGGRPAQLVRGPGSGVLRVIDEPVGPEDVAAMAVAPMDLGRGPLFRAVLFRHDSTDSTLVLTTHHIVADGWSLGIIAVELGQLYAAHRVGRKPELTPLPAQYGDFAVWQRDCLDAHVLGEQLAYWSGQLAGLPPLDLPGDRPRPAVRSARGATVSFEIAADLAARVKSTFDAHRATPFMGLLAAFQLLLARYTGQPDIAVGTPVAGRNRVEVEGLVGSFVNILVLRADLSGRPTFAQLLAQVRETALAAYDHQDLPFEQLVEHLAPERDLSRTPLFAAMFTMQDDQPGGRGWELAGLQVRVVPQQWDVAKLDLAIDVARTDTGFAGVFEYCVDLFDRATVERLAAGFLALLDHAAADAGTPVWKLPMP